MTLGVRSLPSARFQRLTVQYEKPLSSFAFNLNLRPYTEAVASAYLSRVREGASAKAGGGARGRVGAEEGTRVAQRRVVAGKHEAVAIVAAGAAGAAGATVGRCR